VKKSEKPRFYGQNKLLVEHLALQPLGNFNHMAAYRSSSKNVRKMNLILVLNKTSEKVHMESELDVLGVPRKLVKYIVHLFEKKKSLKFRHLFLNYCFANRACGLRYYG
jgi:hypothetical protein